MTLNHQTLKMLGLAAFFALFMVACGSQESDTNAEGDAMEHTTEDGHMHDGESHEGHDHGEMDHGEKHDGESGAMQASDTYYCPMKCEGEKTYDKQGSCPVCGMDLEKVEKKEKQM
ncbi:MAG: hypothetical protein CL946_09140 [Ectothiorhodospiraceae bacterium]|nr:hypothetical protein [Ectothiorhodospiraceae bacterium]